MLTVAIDTETTGIDVYFSCRPFIITICTSDNPCEPFYYRWNVNPLTREVQVVKEDILEIIDWLDKADEIVCQNLKFDCRALVSVGVKWKAKWWGKVQDTLYSAHLLASGEPHDLTHLALKYLRIDIQPLEDHLEKVVKECLGIVKREFPKWLVAKEGVPGLPSLKGSGKDELKKWKWDLWLPWAVAEAKKLPPNHIYRTITTTYANGDSSVTLPIWLEHKRLLQENGNWPLYLKARKLLKVVYEMESRGVTYSSTRLNELLDKFSKQAIDCEKACVALSGGVVDKLPKSGTTKVIRKLLFEDWNIPVIERSEKTGEPSVDKDAIEKWLLTLPQESKAYKFIENLSNNRKCNIACSYMESYRKFGIVLPDGMFVKLHSSLNVTGTNTLRGSSERPNQQNISKQGYANLRYCFGPAKGREWWSIDFKNLEQVIPAYESGEQVLIDLFEKPDIPPYFGSVHLLNASIVYPDEFNECVRNEEEFKSKYKATLYQWIKNAGFALLYGAMEESGTVDRAAHRVGAHARIKKSLTNIDDLNRKMISMANKLGYVETIPTKGMSKGYPIQLGRGRWGKVLATQPLNYHVQSSAMECTRRAMVRCAAYLDSLRPKFNGFITLQIHDELVFDLPITISGNLPIAKKLKSLMELSGNDIGIPITAEYAYHPQNWAEECKVQ